MLLRVSDFAAKVTLQLFHSLTIILKGSLVSMLMGCVATEKTNLHGNKFPCTLNACVTLCSYKRENIIRFIWIIERFLKRLLQNF